MKVTEKRFLIISLFAIVLLMSIHVFQSQITAIYKSANYVSFHTILECFSTSISAIIFLYGFKNYKKTHSSKLLLLSFTFLLVGTLDMLHTLSFKGMPFFITESSVAKATWFWVAARVFQSILILAYLIIPDRKTKRDHRWWLFLIVLAVSAITGYLVIAFENRLPVLFVEGVGTTSLKNAIEYGVSFIQFVSLIFTLYQYNTDKSEANLAMSLAFVYLLLAELILTIYQSVYDIDNFTGHIFKAIGFFFILKSFFFSQQVDEEKSADTPIFNKLPGFIFIAVKRGNELILTYSEGELFQKLGLSHEEIAGQSLAVFSEPKSTIIEYCRLAINLQESIRFEMDFMDKSFLVSIKPSYDQQENQIIIGTVIDLSGVFIESTTLVTNQNVPINSK